MVEHRNCPLVTARLSRAMNTISRHCAWPPWSEADVTLQRRTVATVATQRRTGHSGSGPLPPGGPGWTWAQWHDRIRRVAGGLAALGLGRGDRVAFLDKNNPACLEVEVGAGQLGAACAVINWRLAAGELDYVINDSGASVLFAGSELLPAVEAIRDRL